MGEYFFLGGGEGEENKNRAMIGKIGKMGRKLDGNGCGVDIGADPTVMGSPQGSLLLL